MQVTVKLYGTLQKLYPGYQHSEGIKIIVPDGTTIAELLLHLNLSLEQNISIIMNGRVQKADEKISDGAGLNLFQLVHGG